MAITAQLNRIEALANNGTFQGRVASAMLDQIVTIAGEVGTTTDHANRLSLAQHVIFEPIVWAQRLTRGVIVASGAIQSAISSDNMDTVNAAVTDAQIATSITNVWNFYADAFAAGGLG